MPISGTAANEVSLAILRAHPTHLQNICLSSAGNVLLLCALIRFAAAAPTDTSEPNVREQLHTLVSTFGLFTVISTMVVTFGKIRMLDNLCSEALGLFHNLPYGRQRGMATQTDATFTLLPKPALRQQEGEKPLDKEAQSVSPPR
eukprot:2686402-Prymnesium_polylepis.1